MRFIPNAVTRKVAMSALKLQKQNPNILFGVGIVGIVGTVVLASRATLKLEETLEETQSKLDEVKSVQLASYSDTDRKRDTVILYTDAVVQIGKLYGPSIILGVLSISCLAGSHNMLTKRNAGLTAAYAALDKSYRNYRQRVIDTYGPEKEHEINYPTVVEDEVNPDTGKKEKVVKSAGFGGSPYARLFDEFSPNWNRTFEYNQLFIGCQQNYANDLLKAQGHVFLNEVYDMLGLDRSKEGAVVGWIYDETTGDGYIDFGVFSGDKTSAMRFVKGEERSIWLDFNVDGLIYDKI